MNFKEFLNENSLFTDPSTRSQLVDNIEEVMNSLVFNYFGYLGLVKLNNKAGYLKTYQKSDKPITNINNVSDDSNDVSLSIKLAYDAGAVKRATIMRMNRLLLDIRQKKIDSTNLEISQITSILDDIKYTTFKPSTRILQLVKDLHSGTISLPIFTKKLYILSKSSDYMKASTEFRDLVVKGQFIKLFSNLSDSELESDKTPEVAVTPTPTATPATIPTAAPTPAPAAPKTPDAFFFKKS